MNTVLVLSVVCSLLVSTGDRDGTDDPLAQLKQDARTLSSAYTSPLAQRMLAQVGKLPVPEPKTIHATFRPNRVYTEDELGSMSEEDRAKVRTLEFEPANTYTTFYGTPLVYARVLELAQTRAGITTIDGADILDLGYGQLGQLRLWAQMGADVTGVEVDPILTALYEDSELLGDLDGDPETSGSLRVLECAFPQDEACAKNVGDGYELIVSRNLLKRGYVKSMSVTPGFPEPVGHGMEDDEILGAFYQALSPGGVLIIESLGSAPDPAKPWSDISNPWDRAQWEGAGFEVIAHDEDENHFVREQGRALGWGESMNLDEDLFSVYSIYRKPG